MPKIGFFFFNNAFLFVGIARQTGGRGYKLGLTAAVRKARGGVPGGAFGGDTKESEIERERERVREWGRG